MPGPWEQFQQPVADDGPKPWEQFPAKKTADKGFGQQLNEAIADAPRQLGLTARYGIEGVGGMLDTLASPIRGALNLIPGVNIKPAAFPQLADSLGLPQPKNGTERVVGDASRMLAGSLVPIGAGAMLAKNGTGVAQGVGTVLAANPGAQLASSGAAGAAGGYTRETGGNEGSQLAATLAAGLATPFALAGGQRLVQGTARAITGRPAAAPAQVDQTINNALSGEGGPGFTLADLPADVATGLRGDVAAALKQSDNLSTDAVRRLADYRLTGLSPTKAGLTLDVGDITRQRNLAKLGVNSTDPAAQQLAQTQNSNNMQMTNYLNDLGAATADDQVAGAGKVISALTARNDAEQLAINKEYAKARMSDGRSAMLDHQSFVNDAQGALDEALVSWKVPRTVANVLEKIKSGEMPLTINTAEQLKTQLSELSRLSNNGIEQKALGVIRGALEETPLLPGQEIGQGAMDAFNEARALHRNWMEVVDNTPALQAVRAGVEPDQFVQKFIVGRGANADVMDVTMLRNSIQSNQEAMDAVRQQIAAYLKGAAKSGQADEIANFSQSGYNKALRAIGDRKLNLFFPKEQVDQLKALGRVSSYEQVQPAGTAVNNSNTASAGLVGLVDRIASSPIIGKIPFGKAAIAEPAQAWVVGNQAQNALSAPRSLVAGPPTSPLRTDVPRPVWGLTPALTMPMESEEDRRRRALLLP